MDFIQIGFIDVVDIVGFALLLFYVNKMTRGTNAPNILVGILVVYFLWIGVRALDMELLSAVLGNIVGGGVIALIVVFQPEIRRFLHVVGTGGKGGRKSFLGNLFLNRNYEKSNAEMVNSIVEAAKQMSHANIGALIVVQRRSDLGSYAETGVAIDAQISVPLILNIFFKNSPLHDGALIIRQGRIAAAKCMLPSTRAELPLDFGMRHRAAVGVSEESDALVIVVSEETGAISYVSRGEVRRNISPYELRRELLIIGNLH
ncbi:MAG: diadenylate cyclase CdaA [Rikenellaceae bacterium]|jgi:uncharacterized protein (TIGR00159 family)|nr:diadenylate cyclase CdaA [Rikenellaceae bacterium]